MDIGAIFIEKENPNVLLAMLGGPSIPKIELLSDDEVIDGLMSVIHKFFGSSYDNITDPDAIKRCVFLFHLGSLFKIIFVFLGMDGIRIHMFVARTPTKP